MITKSFFFICCLMFGTLVHLTTTTSIQPKFEVSNYINSTQKQQLSQFWNSLNKISIHQNEEWALIADNIKSVINNLSSSGDELKCFQKIENVFRNGLNSKWSAKCKCYNLF